MNTFKRKKKITYTYRLPTDSLESLPHGFKFQKPIHPRIEIFENNIFKKIKFLSNKVKGVEAEN